MSCQYRGHPLMTCPSPTIEQQPAWSTLLPSTSWSTRALGEASSRYHVLASSFPAPPPPPPPAALFPISTCYKFSSQTLIFITLSLLLLRTRKEFSFDYGFLFWLTFSNLPDLTTPPTSDASFPPFPLKRRNLPVDTPPLTLLITQGT